MSSSSPTAFPNGRTLAGLWRQLASLHASISANRSVTPAFWIAHLDVHRVEALVRVCQTVCPDPLALALLQAAALAPDQTLLGLQRAVPVSSMAVRRTAQALEADELVRTDASGHHSITDKGVAAAAAGTWSRSTNQRRAFYFLRANAENHPPSFLPITTAGGTHPGNVTAAFDVRHLAECIQKSREWKQRFRFPAEVDQVLLPDECDASHEAWRRVVLHRVEKLTFVFLPKPSFRGHIISPGSWTLDPATPALEWGDDWQHVFGEYTREPSVDEWREAWLQWVTGNGIAAADASTSRVERRGHRLRVTTARAVLDKLRGARNQPLLHEPWVLAGDDRAKATASLEIVAA